MKRTSSRRARSGAEGALAARELGIAALRAVRGALLLLKLASGRVATAAAARELGVAALRAVRGAVHRLNLVSGRVAAARAAMEPA